MRRDLETEGFVDPRFPAPVSLPTNSVVRRRRNLRLGLLAQHKVSNSARSDRLPRAQSCNQFLFLGDCEGPKHINQSVKNIGLGFGFKYLRILHWGSRGWNYWDRSRAPGGDPRGHRIWGRCRWRRRHAPSRWPRNGSALRFRGRWCWSAGDRPYWRRSADSSSALTATYSRQQQLCESNPNSNKIEPIDRSKNWDKL